MIYQAKSFENLKGLRDFSDQLLKNHLALYQGYVKNTNQLAILLLNKVKLGKTGTMEYAELKRRFGWEFNGMRLHELYFENLTKRSVPLKKQSPLYGKLGGTSGSLVPGSVASWVWAACEGSAGSSWRSMCRLGGCSTPGWASMIPVCW